MCGNVMVLHICTNFVEAKTHTSCLSACLSMREPRGALLSTLEYLTAPSCWWLLLLFCWPKYWLLIAIIIPIIPFFVPLGWVVNVGIILYIAFLELVTLTSPAHQKQHMHQMKHIPTLVHPLQVPACVVYNRLDSCMHEHHRHSHSDSNASSNAGSKKNKKEKCTTHC